MKENSLILINDLHKNKNVYENLIDFNCKLIELNEDYIINNDKLFYNIVLIIINTSDLNNNDKNEIFKMIKNNRYLSLLPIIAISENKEDEELCLDYEVADFLTIPFNINIFKKRLNNILKIRENELNLIENIHFSEKFDMLTEIYNKTTFLEASDKLVKNNSDKKFDIITFKITNLKVINQIFGGKKGDEFLICYANCLDKIFKKENYCVFGRTGGNKFSLCLQSNNNYVKNLFSQLRENILKCNLEFDFSVVYGVCHIDLEKDNINECYDKTIIALKQVDSKCVERYVVYDESLDLNIKKEQKIINEMAKALKNNEFKVYLQSKNNIITGEIIGSEALVRWIHPQKGIIPPSEFIPVFEKNGFIFQLDYYVWEQVCILIKKWIEEGFEVKPVSVNVSKIDLYNPQICNKIIDLCNKYQIPKKLFHLEITESAYTDDPALLQQIIKTLQAEGFIILMDDFGSGYSSLNMLKELPVDILKLDLRFLSDDGHNGRGANILTSVVRMAKWLSLPVIVEGIEREEQINFLKSIGCSIGQGFFYSKPMPIYQFEEFYKKSILNTQKLISNNTNFSKTDINQLWDVNSAANLLFNLMLSPAGIFEYDNNKLEPLKLNDNYFSAMKTSPENYYEKVIDITKLIIPEDRKLFIDALNKAKSYNNITECFCRGINGVNEIIWIKARIRLISTQGNISLFYIVVYDVTKEKEEREQYQIKNEQYRLIAEYTKILVFDYDVLSDIMSYTIEDENNNIKKIVFKNFMQQLPYTKVIHKDDLDDFTVRLKKASISKIRDACDFKADFFGKEKYDKYRSFYISVENDEGKVYRIVGRIEKLSDLGITDNNEANEVLKTIFQSFPCGLCRINIDATIKVLCTNEQFLELIGYTKKEFEVEAISFFSNILATKDSERIRDSIEKAINNKKSSVLFNTKILCKDGQIKSVICGVGITYINNQTNLNITLYNITKLKESKEQLNVNKSMYEIAFEKSAVAMWEYDIINGIYRVSRAFLKFINCEYLEKYIYSKQEVIKYMKEINGDLANHLKYEKLIEQGIEVNEVLRYKDITDPNQSFWAKVIYTPIFDKEGKPVRAIGICQNVSAEMEAQRLYQTEKRYRDVLSSDFETFFEIDLTIDKIISSGYLVNQLVDLNNLSYTKLIKEFSEKYVYKDDKEKFLNIMSNKQLISSFENEKNSISFQQRSKFNQLKEYRWVNNSIHMVLDDVSSHIMCFWTCADINEKKQEEISLIAKARTDALTELLNRPALEENINEKLLEKPSGAFFMLDVDNFKLINDCYGHAFGDSVLQKVATQIYSCFNTQAFVGRIGGDEFAVFAPYIKTVDEAKNCSEKICKNIKDIFEGTTYSCKTSCSVGVAFAPEDGKTFHELYTNADAAQYYAKHNGKNRYHIYDKLCASTDFTWIKDSKWILDEIDASVYISDFDYNLLYINNYMCNSHNVNKSDCIGQKCYKIFMGLNSPCPFCSKKKLKENSFYSRTFYSYKLKKTYLLRGKIIRWNNLKAHLETAFDITELVTDI